METKDGKQAVYAKTRAVWRKWLKSNCQKEKSVWLILYHKKSKVPCVNINDATEEALCFGWIDSLAKKRDAESYYLTFTPRNPKTSKWSKPNRDRVEKLIKEGLMTEHGQKLIDIAKQAGKWETTPPTKNKSTTPGVTAKEFLHRLTALRTTAKADNSRFFRDEDKANKNLGVAMSAIFGLAKEFSKMSIDEVEKLIESEYYEARMGAVSIMDFQARDKKITAASRKELFKLYIKRHDRINNWDLVDRSAPYVVGGYLIDKPRAILYKMARSKNIWERRTSIVSTYYFIRQNDLIDTFKIAELLVHDEHDLINKAVGGWIREAGKRDERMLLTFLDKYAVTMPRVTLRYAIEKLDKKSKDHYLKAAK